MGRIAAGIAIVSIPTVASAQLSDFRGSGFANLVTNGGFETNSFASGTFTTVGVGGSTISNWTVKTNAPINGNVDLWRTTWSGFAANPFFPKVGAQSAQNFVLELNGNANGGRIGQNVNLVAGKKYVLQFWMSANSSPDASGNPIAPPIKSMDIRIDGVTTASETYDTTGLTNQTSPWIKKSVQFTATNSGSRALDFASTNTGKNGLFIDNVTLVMVPEPATGLLALAGAAPLAWFIRRRRVAAI